MSCNSFYFYRLYKFENIHPVTPFPVVDLKGAEIPAVAIHNETNKLNTVIPYIHDIHGTCTHIANTVIVTTYK